MKNRQLIICIWLFSTVVFSWQNVYASSQLADLYKKAKFSVVLIEVLDTDGNSASGSGFYIDDGKKIVTNSHVIEKANKIKVIDSNGVEKIVRHVSFFSKARDLAVISLFEAGKPLDIANKIPEVGESVVTIGNLGDWRVHCQRV